LAESGFERLKSWTRNVERGGGGEKKTDLKNRLAGISASWAAGRENVLEKGEIRIKGLWL